MLLWFAGTSFVTVWLVFRDPAVDYRLVMLGAILPDVVDAFAGGPWLGHTLLASVATLVGVMLATRGRRLLRRRLLALPIGMFLHLVFDGAWADTDVFWWPLSGGDLGEGQLPSVERGWLDVPLELIGLGLLVWAFRRFRLGERERWHHFATTGRLGRDLVG